MNLFNRLSTRFKKAFLTVSATCVFLITGVEAPLIWKNEQTQRVEYAKKHERASEIEKANTLLLKAQEIHKQNEGEAIHCINEAQTLITINADQTHMSYYDNAFKKLSKFPLDEDQIDSMRAFTIEAIRKFKGYEAVELTALRTIKTPAVLIDSPKNASFINKQ